VPLGSAQIPPGPPQEAPPAQVPVHVSNLHTSPTGIGTAHVPCSTLFLGVAYAVGTIGTQPWYMKKKLIEAGSGPLTPSKA
jgi:hypothetical protein